jgi:hypothetical protein
VLRDVAGVKAVDRVVRQRAEMSERVALDAFEPALGALLDHAWIEIDAVRTDAFLLHQPEEDAAAGAEVEDALPAREQGGERLRLPADDGLVAAETRLEVEGVHVLGDEVLVPLLELAEALLQARRGPVAQIEERARHELVDALLALGDRGQPPAQQTDERAPRDRDDRADVALAALRVVRDVLIEDLGESLEGILQLLAEDRPAAR